MQTRQRARLTPRPSNALALAIGVLAAAGCTVKAVGDPKRPITINANVVIDIRGLKNTASTIEEMVAEGARTAR